MTEPKAPQAPSLLVAALAVISAFDIYHETHGVPHDLACLMSELSAATDVALVEYLEIGKSHAQDS